MNRRWLFRHYWWIGPAAGLGVGASIVGAGAIPLTFDVIATIGAGVFGFCYFVQQQKLAETQLFHSLFTSFNARYDAMNGDLADIADAKFGDPEKARKIVIDYFNICAEEYLFYCEGYIHREVWRSWCRGMLWYLRKHPFHEIWDDEVKAESHYGLTFDEIQKGALP